MREPRRLSSEQGDGLAEYALLLALIVGTVFAATVGFKSSVDSLYSTVSRGADSVLQHGMSTSAAGSFSAMVMMGPYHRGRHRGKDKGANKGKKEHGAPAAAARR